MAIHSLTSNHSVCKRSHMHRQEYIQETKRGLKSFSTSEWIQPKYGFNVCCWTTGRLSELQRFFLDLKHFVALVWPETFSVLLRNVRSLWGLFLTVFESTCSTLYEILMWFRQCHQPSLLGCCYRTSHREIVLWHPHLQRPIWGPVDPRHCNKEINWYIR